MFEKGKQKALLEFTHQQALSVAFEANLQRPGKGIPEQRWPFPEGETPLLWCTLAVHLLFLQLRFLQGGPVTTSSDNVTCSTPLS